jgi:endo-1,4-beta-xylanase
MAAAIPGKVEVENFDPSGYFDSTTGNEGEVYRDDVDVDIKSLNSGYAVGWMTSDEWLEYTVTVAVEGGYTFELSAGAVDAGRTITLSSCGTTLTTLEIPQISDWGQVTQVTSSPFHLAAGTQVIRLTVGDANDLDLDSMLFTQTDESVGTGGANGSGGTDGEGGSGGNDGSGGSSGVLPKFVGNITTGYQASMDVGGRVFSDHWDQVTAENAGKWGSVQSSPTSSFNWSTIDQIYDYAESKGIIFKHHVFVWGSQQPSGNITETHVKTWMTEFCQRYPNTRVIDVVNEPPPHTEPSYANAIGGGTNGSWQWITNSFKWAREACPNAVLVLNDYNNVEYGDQNQHFIDIAKTVLDAGGPIDALGAQSHGLSRSVGTDTMKNLLTKMHEDTGLPVYITEYDIDLSDDTAQLGKFKEHIPFFMETEWIHGVTLWGWIYGSTWVPSSGLIRDGQPRAAMTWLMEELGRSAP